MPDIDAYLGLRPGASTKEALVILERKRREMEAALADPERSREAELFLDLYGTIRERLDAPRAVAPAAPAETPDYYQVLGVQAGASYAAIERAWRSLQAAGRDADPMVSQAWRVLGDPLNRANYDRSRREVAAREPTRGGRLREATTNPDGTPATTASIDGPSLRVVELRDDGDVVSLSIPIVITGTGRWRATISVDHPAVSTQPERALTLPPGRHTIGVSVDPRRVDADADARITIGNGHEQHAIQLELRRPRVGWLRAAEPYLPFIVGVPALVLAFTVGMSVKVAKEERPPASVGDIQQLPRILPCFEGVSGPLPDHLDVHTDGFGRTTGFSFGGVTTDATEDCVRQLLVRLEFPATRDGLPTYYRYRITPNP